jgi:hypothetical protein
MTTFTWSFPQFDVAKSEDGLTDVVKVIHWRYDAEDGDYSAGVYGSVGLSAPNSDNFVPLANITKAWAIEAVALDIPAMQAALDMQIAAAKNTHVVQTAAPFMVNK